MAQGGLTAAGSGEEVVPVSNYRSRGLTAEMAVSILEETMKEVHVKSVFGALTLTSIICSLPELAYATPTPTCSACGIIHSAPVPGIGDGVVGFAVAAVILLTVLMLPRIKRLLQTKTV